MGVSRYLRPFKVSLITPKWSSDVLAGLSFHICRHILQRKISSENASNIQWEDSEDCLIKWGKMRHKSADYLGGGGSGGDCIWSKPNTAHDQKSPTPKYFMYYLSTWWWKHFGTVLFFSRNWWPELWTVPSISQCQYKTFSLLLESHKCQEKTTTTTRL